MGETLATKKSGDRDYLFDNLKGLLIFLVVFGHMIEQYYTGSKALNPLDTVYFVIYVFHMPFFIFISGYFSKNVEKGSQTAFYKFMIPYMVLNTVMFFFETRVMGDYISFNLFDPTYIPWYFLCMFAWRLLLPVFKNFRFTIPLSIIIGLVTPMIGGFGTYLGVGRIFISLPFFMIGYSLKREHIDKLRRIPWWVSVIGLIAAVAMSMWICFGTKIPYSMLYYCGPYRSIGNLAPLPGVMYRSLMYVNSAMYIVFITALMPQAKTFLSYVGKRTLPVFFIHWFVCRVIGKYLAVTSNGYVNLLIFFVISVVMTAILSLDFMQKAYDWFFSTICRVFFKVNYYDL